MEGGFIKTNAMFSSLSDSLFLEMWRALWPHSTHFDAANQGWELFKNVFGHYSLNNTVQ